MENLNAKTSCPICNKKRVLQMENIVSKQEKSFVIYNKCPHCVSTSLAVISRANGRGVVIVETLTDLSYEEALAMPNMQALSADAVLEIYQGI